MGNQNASGLVETCLEKISEESSKIGICRTEMANLFNCVPSQINYIINTRFTIQRGYAVESKRGGGGYIRIVKVQILDNDQLLGQMDQLISTTLTERDALTFIQTLHEEEVITEEEGNLILTVLSKSILNDLGNHEDFLRAQIMRSFLECLNHKGE